MNFLHYSAKYFFTDGKICLIALGDLSYSKSIVFTFLSLKCMENGIVYCKVRIIEKENLDIFLLNNS